MRDMTVVYDFREDDDLCGYAVFERKCPKCKQFVKALECTIEGKGLTLVKTTAKGECRRCGTIEMPFLGWF